MKKRLMVVAILALSIILATGAMSDARAAWPPKSLAFQWENPNLYTVLALKPAGKVKMANRTVKFYQLTGVIFYTNLPVNQFPVGGYGYLDGDVFIFSLSGTMYTGLPTHNSFLNLQGRLMPSGDGLVDARSSDDTAWGTSGNGSIVMVPPNTLDLYIQFP